MMTVRRVMSFILIALVSGNAAEVRVGAEGDEKAEDI